VLLARFSFYRRHSRQRRICGIGLQQMIIKIGKSPAIVGMVRF
jgi:hypothetical protein